MSASTIVPMIGPNGEVGDVPYSRIDDAVKAGFQRGVEVQHPGTGERGVIPLARYKDALNGGLVPYSSSTNVPVPAGLSGNGPVAPPTWGSTPSEILSTIGQHAKNLVAGPVHALTSAPQDAREQGVAAATSAVPGGSQISLALDRLLGVSNSVQSLANARNLTGDAKVQAYEDAVPIVGPWAKQIETDVANRGAVAGLSGLATDVLAPTAVAKGAGAIIRRAQYISPAEQSSAFSGLVSRGSGLGKNFDPYATTEQALPAIRQAAANHPEVAQAVQNGGPQQFVGGSQFLVDKAMDSLEQYHAPLRQSVAGHAPFSPDSTPQYAQALDNLKATYPDTPGMAPQRAFVDSLKSDIGNVSSLEDLNRYRKQLNDLAAPSYDKTAVAQNEAPNAQEAYRTAADAVRQDYYNRLQELTGVDLRPTMLREGSLLDVKQSLGSQGSKLLQQNAIATEGQPFVRGVVDRLSKEGINKGVAGVVRDKIFGETPLTQPQYLASRFLSKLPAPSGGLTYGSPAEAAGGRASLLPPRPEQGQQPVATPQGSPTYQLPSEAGSGQTPEQRSYPPLAEQYSSQRTVPTPARINPAVTSGGPGYTVTPQGTSIRRYLSLMPAPSSSVGEALTAALQRTAKRRR